MVRFVPFTKVAFLNKLSVGNNLGLRNDVDNNVEILLFHKDFN